MIMSDNTPLAAAAREWTSATWADRLFLPEPRPDAGTPANLSLAGQTWMRHAVFEEGRITGEDDVVRFTCRDNDFIASGDQVANKVRCELERMPRSPNDSLLWYGFGLRFPANLWPLGGTPPDTWMIICQTHQTSKIAGVVPGQPVFNLELSAAEPSVRIVRNIQDPADPGQSVYQTLATFGVVPGQWHTYVARVQFSGGSTGGSAKCWVDSQVVFDTDLMSDWDGILGYDHNSMLGPKIGTYRHADVGAETVVEFRNPEIRENQSLVHEDYAGYS